VRRGVLLVVVLGFLVVFLGVGFFLTWHQQSTGGRSLTMNVTVTGASRMTPDHLEATQGDTLTINVTSDRAGEVHLHGYDIHFKTSPGQVASRTFRADKTGSFDIEWESTSAPLGNLVVKP
jgi:hypothetical protein